MLKNLKLISSVLLYLTNILNLWKLTNNRLSQEGIIDPPVPYDPKTADYWLLLKISIKQHKCHWREKQKCTKSLVIEVSKSSKLKCVFNCLSHLHAFSDLKIHCFLKAYKTGVWAFLRSLNVKGVDGGDE